MASECRMTFRTTSREEENIAIIHDHLAQWSRSPAKRFYQIINNINDPSAIHRDTGFGGCMLYRRVVHRRTDGTTA